MAALGVHFSLSEDEVQEVLRLELDCERLEHLHEVLEEKYFDEEPERKAESDKAWEAIERVLSSWEMPPGSGKYPMAHVILGGESIYASEDYLMLLKAPSEVVQASTALEQVVEEQFRQRYYALDPATLCSESTGQDFAYTWEWFREVRQFWVRAAAEGRYVLFTAPLQESG